MIETHAFFTIKQPKGIKKKKKKKFILRIRNLDGQWSSNREEVADNLVQCYQDLFTLANPSQSKETLQSINTLITAKMNDQLSSHLMAWEVQAAVKQMAPLKVPEPDCMPPIFYQKYWQLVGDKVTQSILHFLSSASFPSHLNHTLISLIPKVKNPKLVIEFLPISLCNVLYKIFPKVLANRLKKILPQLITEQQNAFTKSHLISDNILVAFESLHSMHKHRSSKEGFMMVKLDISKSYDGVEWPFLEVVMQKMALQRAGYNC